MTPDAFTNVQIVNCTNAPLVASNVGEYQMNAWYAPNVTVAPNAVMPPYGLVFQNGVGDEDDAGNATFTSGSTGFSFYAGSTNQSGHYIVVRDMTPSDTFVFGVVTNGVWPASPAQATQITWYPFNSTQTINLPLAAPSGGVNAFTSLAIVDLTQLYPATASGQMPSYSTVQQAIANSTLTVQQQEDLWLQVTAYVAMDPAGYPQPSVTYALIDVVFASTSPTETSQQIITTTPVQFDTGTYTQTFTVQNTYENSVVLTASRTWSLGATIEVNVPLEIVPGATFSASFEAGSTESTGTTITGAQEFSQQIELSEPGSYQIVSYLSIDDDYTTTFSGTVLVTGTLAGAPINGVVLGALAARQEWQLASASTAQDTSLTATVSGTVAGNVAYDGGFTETKLA